MQPQDEVDPEPQGYVHPEVSKGEKNFCGRLSGKRDTAGALVGALAVFAVWFFMAASPLEVLAGELSAAPENPEFTQYVKQKNLRLLRAFTAEGHALSYLPSPLKHPSPKANTTLLQATALPAEFDLRTVGGVTAVKDQGTCGSCWTFATNASLESFLQYKNSLHQTWDFSEQDMNEYHGFDYRECEGGNYDMATAYLARWGGPVSTSDVPYFYAGPSLAEAPGAEVQKHVQNVWYLPERTGFTDNSQVKTAIKTYGAVGVAFYYGSSYYNETTAAYYYNGPKGQSLNHAVALVGWDDNYTSTNFKVGQRPPAKGAFLAKNSWGTDWGKDGYFYLSYYDKSLSVGFCYFNAEEAYNYRRAYQYDPLGWTTSLGFSSTTAWFANVFKAASGAARIKAVGFYTPVPNTSYEIFIYKDVTGSDPRNGVLVKTRSGTLAKAGYRTIKTFLSPDKPPAVVPGSKFSVIVKLTTPGYNYPIPIEKDIYGYSTAANAYTGQSFVSEDGLNWDDLTTLAIGTSQFKRANVCLKAFGS